MIPLSQVPTSGDREHDLRRAEQWTWRHYLRSAHDLASMPTHGCDFARARTERAKAEWAAALRALDRVLR